MTTPVELVVTTFEAGRAEIAHVRDAVFIHEQGIDADEEYDQDDPGCIHVVLRCDGGPVATGRLDVGQGGRFGRIAVLAPYRGRGLGQRIVVELERLAIEAGMTQAWFHAQTAALAFYQRLGYQATGPEFMEAGIPHVRMFKLL